MTKVKVFSLYGDFIWPPIPITNPSTAPTKRAVVEIWYVLVGEKYQALLNWSVGEITSEPTDELTKSTSNVFELSDEDITKHFENNKKGILRICQGNVETKNLKEKLRFRGAVLFKQHLEGHKLEWPLVRLFSYGEKEDVEAVNYYSELRVGEDGRFSFNRKADFKFRLALPSPVSQTSSDDYTDPHVFVVNSWFHSTVDDQNKLGWVREEDGLSLGARKEKYLKPAGSKVLGNFGYAIDPTDENKSKFAYYNSDEDDFWPTGNHDSVFDFLKLAGLTISKSSKNLSKAGPIKYLLSSGRNENQASVSCIGSSGFVWRLNLQCEEDSTSTSTENAIWIDKGVFKTNINEHVFQSEKKELLYEIYTNWSLKEEDLKKWLTNDATLTIFNLIDIRLKMRSLHDSPLIDVLNALPNAMGAMPQSFLPAISPNIVGRQIKKEYDLGLNHDAGGAEGEGLLPGFSGGFSPLLPNILGAAESKLNFDINTADFTDQTNSKIIPNKYPCLGYLTFVGAQVRLGALSFTLLSEKENKEKEKSNFEIVVEKSPAGFSYTVTLELQVTVSPVTVDLPWGQRELQAAPLLIRNNNDIEKQSFLLNVEETFGDEQDWQLTAKLLDTTSDASKAVTYNVIADQPFALFRFARLPLGLSGDERSGEVAIYNSDERTWLFKKINDANSYHYVLPPQSIGESADKPRRLEIYDTDNEDSVTALQPYLDSPKNLYRTLLVEHRLTPSAELWIKPSDLERNYFLPEWSAHDIFRQRNDFGLGVALLGLRAEFLYGLTVGVDTSLEQGPSRSARVAEIEAIMGRLPSPVKEKTDKDVQQYKTLIERWELLRQAMQRRYERLEVWATDPASNQLFAPARFSDGVSFALRKSALHRAPVFNPETINVEPENLNSAVRYHPQGLPGGALWPIEFWNVFEQLCAYPDSSGGTLEKVAFSPTGGDANQKALFLNGVVSIISETRSGFVQRQQVEILGRIGAHWHRAKHVVVYERTVNPSAQFAPELDEFSAKRSRRPILRKVSEYIELLQPERLYPDGAGAAKDRGFLHSIRYNSVRIAVDSAWGNEIGKVGYQIPLWNLYSARIRPQVYPMPDVVFNLLCEGEADGTTCAKQCLDPNNIYFFADIESRNPNTDEWIPRLGIDAVNALPASHIMESDEKYRAESKNTYKSSVSRILPGYRRFTWRLAPGGPKARINAEYGERAIFAEVESISFMRSIASIHIEIDSMNAGGQQKLFDLTQQLELETNKSWPQWSNDIGGDSSVSKLKKLVVAFNAEAENVQPGGDVAKAKDAFDALIKSVNGEWADHRKNITEHANNLKTVSSNLGAVESGLKSCEALQQDTVDAIRRKRHLLEAALSEWQNRALVSLDLLSSSQIPETWRTQTNKTITDDIKKELKPLFESAYTPIDSVKDDIEKARAIVSASEADLERALLRVIARLDAMKAAYQDGKPWSADRIKRVHEKIQQEWMSVKDELQAIATEAKQRASIELSQRSHELSVVVNRALQVAVDGLNESIAAQSQTEDAFEQFFASLKAPLDKLLDASDGVFKQATDLLPKLNSKPAIQKAVKTLLEKANSIATTTKTNIKTLEEAAKAELTEVLAEAEKLKKEVSDARSQIDANLSDIETVLKKIEDSDADLYVKNEILALVGTAEAQTNRLAKWAEGQLGSLGNWADPMIDEVIERLRAGITKIMTFKNHVFDAINTKASELQTHIGAIAVALAPDRLIDNVTEEVISLWIERLLAETPDSLIDDINGQKTEDIKKILRGKLATIADGIAGIDGELLKLERSAIKFGDEVSVACKTLSNSYQDAIDGLNTLTETVNKEFNDKISPLYEEIQKKINDASQYADIVTRAGEAATSLGEVVDKLGNAIDSASAVSQRLQEAATQVVDGNLAAMPNNLLKLYSAATSALDSEPLQTNIHQLRCAWDDVINTTKGNALLAGLGDKLKALGIDIPFDQIGDTFKIDNEALENFDFSRMFKNFAGINMYGLFKGVKLPANINDAIRLSHDFDKKQSRAWVQVDVNASVPGRNPLFAVGPFALYFKDSQLIGNIRLEASKDTNEVKETGSSTLITSIEAAVSGQVMVVLENAALNYTQESGLKFDFDPANIKLHPNFRFIQETLGQIFPDEMGGLNIIKDNGIPIGVEHVFALPNMSLNFGTSGVQNIQIANRFRMLAYPDFLIANRFNLSKVEMPFIFSVFILGGTGYIQIDAEYQPISGRLLVVVEAAAGASAALAFSFGPVQGSVFITLAVALTYRKLIGSNGGGLSVSLVLVVAGNVSLWGMVNIYLGLILRMTYRDSGQIDADGTLAVEVRVSRFFKLTYQTTVTYKLRGGSSESTRKTSVDVETDDRIKDIREKAKLLKDARS